MSIVSCTLLWRCTWCVDNTVVWCVDVQRLYSFAAAGCVVILDQRFSIPVPAPPLCIFRMLLLTLQMFVLFERKCPAKWTSQDIPPWFQFEANVYSIQSALKCARCELKLYIFTEVYDALVRAWRRRAAQIHEWMFRNKVNFSGFPCSGIGSNGHCVGSNGHCVGSNGPCVEQWTLCREQWTLCREHVNQNTVHACVTPPGRTTSGSWTRDAGAGGRRSTKERLILRSGEWGLTQPLLVYIRYTWSALLTSWLSESGVLTKIDMQNMQSGGARGLEWEPLY